MNNEERVKILERSFDLLDELLNSCFCDDEKQTREKFNKEIDERYKKSNDPIEKLALMDAKVKFSDLSWPEIEECYEIVAEDLDEDDGIQTVYTNDPKMRSKVIKTEIDSCFDLVEDNGTIHVVYLINRLAYNSKFYVHLISFEVIEGWSRQVGVFFEYVVGERSINDKLVMVQDEKLIKELSELSKNSWEKP